MFVTGKPLQSSLMFAGKAGAYPSEAPSLNFETLLSEKSHFAELFYSAICFIAQGPVFPPKFKTFSQVRLRNRTVLVGHVNLS